MKTRINVPVIFHAPVTSGGLQKKILTFVPTDFEIPVVTDDEAPLAISEVVRDRIDRRHRLYDGRLYSALQRANRDSFSSLSNRLKSVEIDVSLKIARQALAYLERAKLDDIHPRSARKTLSILTTPNPDLYQKFVTAIEGSSDDRQMNDLAARSDDYDACRTQWTARVQSLIDKCICVDAKLYTLAWGPAVRVAYFMPDKVELRENNLDLMSVGGRDDWFTPLDEILLSSMSLKSIHFAAAEIDEAMQFGKDLALRTNRKFELEQKLANYHIPRHLLPQLDMRYAELVRSAKLVTAITGREIARRFKNRERSIFEDDPSIRHAFDGLLGIVKNADPFGEQDSRLEAQFAALLDALRVDPRKANSMYRNMMTTYKAAFELADVVLARWDERPMDIQVQLKPTGGMRP